MFHHLTMKQLETFFWAARLGSFSAAAARLNTTQPSVSVRIRDMEAVLHVPLFDRTGRMPRLTSKGRQLAAYVERVVALGEEFDSALGRPDTISGLVRVGAADTVALTWLPDLVAELGRRHPKITIELIVDLSINLRARLLSGDLDIGLLVGELSRPEFEDQSLGFVEQRWMCSPSLGVPATDVTAEMLVRWPVFTHTRGSDHFRAMQHWFEAEGVRPERLHGCSSLATMVAMTVAGLGISVLPAGMLQTELAGGNLELIETRRLVPEYEFREIHLVHPARRAVSAVATLARQAARRSPVFRLAEQRHRPKPGGRKPKADACASA